MGRQPSSSSLAWVISSVVVPYAFAMSHSRSPGAAIRNTTEGCVPSGLARSSPRRAEEIAACLRSARQRQWNSRVKRTSSPPAGGILFGGLFMLLYGAILHQFGGIEVNFPLMVVYGLVGSAITELGDLSFSLIKRQYGIKDYGNVIPGHGGMLDRFDSMTFAAPALWLMVTLFPAF